MTVEVTIAHSNPDHPKHVQVRVIGTEKVGPNWPHRVINEVTLAPGESIKVAVYETDSYLQTFEVCAVDKPAPVAVANENAGDDDGGEPPRAA